MSAALYAVGRLEEENSRLRAELAAEKERASEIARKADQNIRDLFIPSAESGTGEYEWNAAVSTSLNCLKRASNAALPQMEGSELVKAHRAYFDGYMEARFTAEAPPHVEQMECRSCGSAATREELKAGGFIACCPERTMNEVIERDHGVPALVPHVEAAKTVTRPLHDRPHSHVEPSAADSEEDGFPPPTLYTLVEETVAARMLELARGMKTFLSPWHNEAWELRGLVIKTFGDKS